ncbi:MAG: hypothetical protein LUG91_03695 [Ruminococcus sp.]|nr:hypothetical protein [Ruminococcus sp.]
MKKKSHGKEGHKMSIGTFCVIGGIGAAVIIAALLASKRSTGSETTLSEVISEKSDEQLVVDTLNPSDLTKWFRLKNPEKKFSNVIIFPNEKNIALFKLPKGMVNDTHNTILQVLFDKKANKIILYRTVVFEHINAELLKKLNENDGTLVVE